MIDKTLKVTIRKWNDDTQQWEDDATLDPKEEDQFDLDAELEDLEKFLDENFKKSATDGKLDEPEFKREYSADYVSKKDKPNCSKHKWVPYYGLSNIAQYEYCDHCGEKKDED